MRIAFPALLIAILAFRPAPAAPGVDRPNVLFIFMDDYGWKDLSFMGSDYYETPNLDRLAKEGMIFTDAYACAANCAPSRGCLLSGQYTPRHEIFNVGTGPRGNAKHRRLKHVPGTSTLRPDIVTWAHAVKRAGYRTATMGKWHLSKDPIPYGFDVNVGGTHSGGPPKGYFPPHPAPGLKDVPKGEYLTDTLTDEAIKFITANKEKPWFLYLTHFAVHTPIQGRKDLVAKYSAKTKGKLHNHAVMAAMIESVDQGVGRLAKTLKDLGLDEKTAIIFYSDNGGYGPATSMRPLKGYKGTYYEGGIRVPFFVRWPGTVKPATECDEPITGVDLYPTFCDVTGAARPEGQPMDGVSLLPLFKGAEKLDREAIYWHFPAYLQSYSRKNEQRDPLFRSRPCSIIRSGDWKLHEYFEDGGLELYNLKEDVSEAKNLADSKPDKVKELHAMLKKWRAEVKAPVPTEPNPAFDADAEKAAIEAAKKGGGGKKRRKKKD